MCVCCTHLFSFFTLAFVLVNDLSLVSRCFLFWKCVRFCFRFCCRLFLFVVCTCILCLLPCHTRCSFIDVLSCTPTGVSEINHLNCSRCNFHNNVCAVAFSLSLHADGRTASVLQLCQPPAITDLRHRPGQERCHWTELRPSLPVLHVSGHPLCPF